MYMLFMKQRKIRNFTYRPQFYKPDDMIEEEENTSRIKFRRIRGSARPAKRRSRLIMLLLIFIILFMIHYFNNLRKSEQQSVNQDFQVEEIIVK